MKMKNAAIAVIALCGVSSAVLLAVPEMVLDSVPTATLVNVETIEHEDSISLSGTVIKNLIDDSVCVQVYVPEQDISKVKLGQPAEITGDAFPGVTYGGTVDKISDVALKIQSGNIQMTAVEVTVSVKEPDDTLKHGYTASVKLSTSGPSIMEILPYEAINQDDNGEFVYILKNGRVYKRYVETGRELSGGVELKTSISSDENIITVDKIPENGSAVKFGDE